MDPEVLTALPLRADGVQILRAERHRAAHVAVLIVEGAVHGHEHVEGVSTWNVKEYDDL